MGNCFFLSFWEYIILMRVEFLVYEIKWIQSNKTRKIFKLDRPHCLQCVNTIHSVFSVDKFSFYERHIQTSIKVVVVVVGGSVSIRHF